MEERTTARSGLPALAAVPAAPPAAAALVGTVLGRVAAYAPPGPLVALALLGLALASGRDGSRRRARARAVGLALGAFALATLNAHVRSDLRPAPLDPGRPVTAVVEAIGHWRRLGAIWSAPVRVERIRQGSLVLGAGAAGLDPMFLHVSSDGPAPSYGARLRVKGFLDRPVALGNPPPRPPGPWRLRVKSARLVAVEGGPGPVARTAAGLRRRVEVGLRRTAEIARVRAVGGPAGEGLGVPLARALVLGDASDVPDPVLRALRRLGLAHVLAVSGLHVGLVGWLVLILAGPLPRPLRWGASLAALAFYLLLVGPRPSLVRASTMAFLALLALLVERPPSAANALAVVAAGIALVRPAAVADVGFQLSVGATAGLLVLGPALARSWSRAKTGSKLPGPVRDALAVSVGAQLGTLPWALPLFTLVVPAAPLANLVAVPWTLVALAGAGLWVLTAVAAPAAAAAALPALDLLAAPFGMPAALPPTPWASLPLAAGPFGAAALASVLAAALARPRIGFPLVVLAWVGAAGVVDRLPGPAGREVELVAIDVGQGDAILLRDGPETLLVDGGGWPAGDLGGRVLLPTVAGMGIRRLDRMLLTHGDRDHCGGLVELAGYLEVGEVLTGPAGPDGPCDEALRRLPGTAHRVVREGSVLEVGRWRVRVLQAGVAGPRDGTDNDGSVVLAAEALGRRVLLTGDAEAAAERRLIAEAAAELDAFVLKVAHHGSQSSSTDGLLGAVSPALALVSAGARNPYGHPAPEVLERLRRHGARILRTDRDGMIVLRFLPDGRWEIDLPGAPKR